MKKPRFGEGSLGAVVGAVVGAVGGLVAVTIPYAILSRDLHALSAARTLGLVGFFVSTPVGWLLGGQIGPRLEGILNEKQAGYVGGFLGGLVPIAGLVWWGWHLVAG